MLQLMTHKARVLDIPPARRRERIEVGRVVEVRLLNEGIGEDRIEARVERRGWLAGLFGARAWLPFGRIEPDAPRGLVACLARAGKIRCRVVEVSPRHLWADPEQPEIYVSLWADLPEVMLPTSAALRQALTGGARRDPAHGLPQQAARRG
ncbi:hypothetical protein GVY41_04430 [Frigidibacter albus]|uniref:Uncharacterized protein n=1 Tax=Frigidibacter albus TaxID=1465486 RepID=A0A6L8VCY9_9RHOB|nr:hypothetical protein [Frigidibacter albus]MZQ88074.1 hypothetical protein [Frigidibacter albus]NBE30252.1 hypothetical protein [Frigidibacter albus]GGH47635.1 hypothetical protein GCM10011341_08910 [Frigidibacter albus]